MYTLYTALSSIGILLCIRTVRGRTDEIGGLSSTCIHHTGYKLPPTHSYSSRCKYIKHITLHTPPQQGGPLDIMYRVIIISYSHTYICIVLNNLYNFQYVVNTAASLSYYMSVACTKRGIFFISIIKQKSSIFY